jgi:hypothetical protein
VCLTTFSERSSFDEGMGVISSGAGELVEEGFNDPSGAVELETVGVGVDEGVESLGGSVFGDHAALEERRERG